MRLLHGNERSGDRSHDASVAVSERYSVDELRTVASLLGHSGFPGVPAELEPSRSPRVQATITEVVVRSLVARSVLSAAAHTPTAPHGSLFAVAMEPDVTCSIQRFRPGDLSARNGFLAEGLLVEQTSPIPNIIELRACDDRDFGRWLAEATGWSATPRLRAELRQITRTAQKIRSIFNALGTDVPTTLDDQPVVDAGRVVTFRRRDRAADGVDLAWITTVESLWVFPHASELLTGYSRPTVELTLQATTESELTRVVARSVRPVAVHG
ncbi:MAG: hypothetical protein ACXVJ7_02655 [Acidimicrobiia bacterium]